jgi:hypothetical protein
VEDSASITWWMALLTALVAVQTIALGVMAFAGLRAMRRAEAALASAEQSLGPLAARASVVLDDLRALSNTAQRADQSVRAVIGKAERGLAFVGGGVTRKLWPVFGFLAAGRAVARTISARRKLTPPTREDEMADARFVAEGGPINDVR